MIALTQQVIGGAARRRPPYFKTKKLGLIGATASVQFAPWFDSSWTLAAHPCARQHCKREPDWYFDMHRRECFMSKKSWNKDYYKWLQRLQTPVFMQEDWPEIPMAVRYPLERVTAEFRPYFTNHVSYMIALAMTEGVTHIGLFGCQYAHETEHGVQRDSMTYWLGRFEQSGGTIVIPQKFNTVLAHPNKLYGYESHDKHGKLVPEYQARPSQKLTPEGDVDEAPIAGKLEPFDVENPEHRQKLMQLPGQEPAWDRCGVPV